MRSVLLLAALLLRRSACAPKSYTMQGKDADQMLKDEQQCRAQVRAQAQNDRNIEDQRRSVFEGERERFGQQAALHHHGQPGLQEQPRPADRRAAWRRAAGRPSSRTASVTWWNRNSTFNTPLAASSRAAS